MDSIGGFAINKAKLSSKGDPRQQLGKFIKYCENAKIFERRGRNKWYFFTSRASFEKYSSLMKMYVLEFSFEQFYRPNFTQYVSRGIFTLDPAVSNGLGNSDMALAFTMETSPESRLVVCGGLYYSDATTDHSMDVFKADLGTFASEVKKFLNPIKSRDYVSVLMFETNCERIAGLNLAKLLATKLTEFGNVETLDLGQKSGNIGFISTEKTKKKLAHAIRLKNPMLLDKQRFISVSKEMASRFYNQLVVQAWMYSNDVPLNKKYCRDDVIETIGFACSFKGGLTVPYMPVKNSDAVIVDNIVADLESKGNTIRNLSNMLALELESLKHLINDGERLLQEDNLSPIRKRKLNHALKLERFKLDQSMEFLPDII